MDEIKGIKQTFHTKIKIDEFLDSKLFSEFFLAEGIKNIEAWQNITDSECIAFLKIIVKIFSSIKDANNLVESDIEDSIIHPILKHFGFYYLRQTHLHQYIPDYGLYLKEEDYDWSREHREELWNKSDCLLEAKRGNRNLDLSDKNDKMDPSNPSNKMVSYIEAVWKQTNRRIKHGFLTNGKEWRIYTRETDLKSKKYFNIKLEKLAKWLTAPITTLDSVISYGTSNYTITLLELIKIIILFLSSKSYNYSIGIEKNCVIDQAISENLLWEKSVSDVLKQEIFITVIPLLTNGFLVLNDFDSIDESLLNELYHDVLIFLYRILFVMHAEDRKLLPTEGKYRHYSLQKLRIDIASWIDKKEQLSPSRSQIFNRLKDLFQLINEGDSELNVIKYNGKLFGDSAFFDYNRLNISDFYLSKALDYLSRDHTNGDLPWINYAELSVKHLGNIYESLLDFRLAKAHTEMAVIRKENKEFVIPKNKVTGETIIDSIPEKTLYLTNENSERKATGSYFTPDYIVRYITEETIDPHLKKVISVFEEKLKEMDENKTITIDEKIKILDQYDPIQQIIDMKILDPAVGSGHFLVYAYEFLSEKIETLLNNNYTIENQEYIFLPIRDITEIEHLDYLKRIIIKRCLYGIDINDLAVELAKLCLWLSSFTPNYPLSFLDHHIKVGNSLLGINTLDLINTNRIKKGPLDDWIGINSNIQTMIGQLSNIIDLDIDQVHQSIDIFNKIEKKLTNIKIAFNLELWARIPQPKTFSKYRKSIIDIVRNFILNGNFDDIDEDLLNHIKSYAISEKFFHLGLEFFDLLKIHPKTNRILQRKFDFIITNPPYGGKISNDKIKEYYKSRFVSDNSTEGLFTSFITENCNRFGYIVPKTISFYANRQPIREKLFKFLINNVLDTGLAFEDVNYETIIIIASDENKGKNKIGNHQVSIACAHPLKLIKPMKNIIHEKPLPFSYFLENQIIYFREITTDLQKILLKIQNNSIFLKDIVNSAQIFRGLYIPDARKRDILNNPEYIIPSQISDEEIIWINKVPDISRYLIKKYYKVQFDSERDSKYIEKANKVMQPRLFLKVLRGNRLVAFPENGGNFCTTEKLVNVVISDDCEYSRNFICGIINSPYPSYYIALLLFCRTTETSRVMDYPYSCKIPIPKITFNASKEDLNKFIESIEPLFPPQNYDIEKIIQGIEDKLNQGYQSKKSHILHFIIDLSVEKILGYHEEKKIPQIEFVEYVSLNFSDNFKNGSENEKWCFKMRNKIGLREWPDLVKDIRSKFQFDPKDLISLAKYYHEIQDKIVIHINKIKFYEDLIDELARISFNLDVNEKEIVQNFLNQKQI